MDNWVLTQLHPDPIPGAALTVVLHLKKKKKVKGEI